MKYFTILLGAVLFCLQTQAAPVHAVFFGDTPYKVPKDYPRLAQLQKQIHDLQPHFAMHVGDTLRGPCTDEKILKVKDIMSSFEVPLLYTPGDNEWTDCHRSKSGSYDPLERLGLVRNEFYGEQLYFGRQDLGVQSQTHIMSEHSEFVENLTWTIEGVRFVSLHIVGSNNNFDRDYDEYEARNTANLAWLRYNFAQAKMSYAKAVVLVFHANIFDTIHPLPPVPSDGFESVYNEMIHLIRDFRGPVVGVHGDSHTYRFDMPTSLVNFYRLEVFGAKQVRGVELVIDTTQPQVFQAFPLPAN